jgi:hypothetical protein
MSEHKRHTPISRPAKASKPGMGGRIYAEVARTVTHRYGPKSVVRAGKKPKLSITITKSFEELSASIH